MIDLLMKFQPASLQYGRLEAWHLVGTRPEHESIYPDPNTDVYPDQSSSSAEASFLSTGLP